MSLQHALLGVLEARPMSGYDLVQFFDSAAGWVWAAPQSQIYPLLRKMQEDGLIAGEQQVRGTRQKRTVYSITDDGLAELNDWVSTPHASLPIRDPAFLQALFFDMIEPDRAIAVLQELIAEQDTLISQWEEHRDKLRAGETSLLRERLQNRPAEAHERIRILKAQVFEGMVDIAKARRRWAKRSIRALQAGPAPTGAANSSAGS